MSVLVGAGIGALVTLVVAHRYFQKTTEDLEALRDEIRRDVRKVIKFLDWWRKGTGPEMAEDEGGWEVRRPVSAWAGVHNEALKGIRSGGSVLPHDAESTEKDE